MERERAEAIYEAGREAVVEALLEAWAGLERVTGAVDELRGRVDELDRQIDRDSTDSSMPPSADAPKSRAERRRLAREAYKRSMRKSGGQPGHEGKTRELAAPERIDKRVGHLPDRCGCGHEFDGSEERVGDPVVCQQFELPAKRREMTQDRCRASRTYSWHRSGCRCGGESRSSRDGQ